MRQHLVAFLVALGVWALVNAIPYVQPASALSTGIDSYKCTYNPITNHIQQCGSYPWCTGFCSWHEIDRWVCTIGLDLQSCTQPLRPVPYRYYSANCAGNGYGACLCDQKPSAPSRVGVVTVESCK